MSRSTLVCMGRCLGTLISIIGMGVLVFVLIEGLLKKRKPQHQKFVDNAETPDPLSTEEPLVLLAEPQRLEPTLAEPVEVAPCQDELLRTRLQECASDNEDYWSFRDNSRRECVHSYFQYPAMMVPQMLGQLITTITSVEGNIKRIYDPFTGSGTVLGEAMSHGLSFEGQDINPLAVLVSRTKYGPYNEVELEGAIARLWEHVEADQCEDLEVDFPNYNKWFFSEVAHPLSCIRRGIRAEEQLWIRRFLWVALAETVRLTSNSRTSTFKLHKRDDDDLERRRKELKALETFNEVLEENFAAFQAQRRLLLDEGYLKKNGAYKHELNVRHRDSSLPFEGKKCHLLVTSPPYGDNTTTVPYGQSAYLPLQWIDLQDIEPSLTAEWISNTHAIDTKSLGGSLKEAKDKSEVLRKISPAFVRIMEKLEPMSDESLAKKVASFCYDFQRCIRPATSALRSGSPMVWVVGNRSVGGHVVPLDEILADFLRAEGASEIVSLSRTIPSKRMPSKNRSSSTMGNETIMVWRTKRTTKRN